MENIQQQVAALQKSVQRQRIAIFVLAGICTAGVLVGATKPIEDATFDTITCKKWVVVDGRGSPRIVGEIMVDGSSLLRLVDNDGKMRIAAGTFADGIANLSLLDKDGKTRMAAATFADGDAILKLCDKDGKMRIAAGTFADGAVRLPIVDVASPKK